MIRARFIAAFERLSDALGYRICGAANWVDVHAYAISDVLVVLLLAALGSGVIAASIALLVWLVTP